MERGRKRERERERESKPTLEGISTFSSCSLDDGIAVTNTMYITSTAISTPTITNSTQSWIT